MIEGIKEFIGIFKDIPQLAIWALVVVFAYKSFIVGSIYAVIRFVAVKLVEYKVLADKSANENARIVVELRDENARLNREIEEVKHMYKILKDTKDVVSK